MTVAEKMQKKMSEVDNIIKSIKILSETEADLTRCIDSRITIYITTDKGCNETKINLPKDDALCFIEWYSNEKRKRLQFIKDQIADDFEYYCNQEMQKIEERCI